MCYWVLGRVRMKSEETGLALRARIAVGVAAMALLGLAACATTSILRCRDRPIPLLREARDLSDASSAGHDCHRSGQSLSLPGPSWRASDPLRGGRRWRGVWMVRFGYCSQQT